MQLVYTSLALPMVLSTGYITLQLCTVINIPAVWRNKKLQLYEVIKSVAVWRKTKTAMWRNKYLQIYDATKKSNCMTEQEFQLCDVMKIPAVWRNKNCICIVFFLKSKWCVMKLECIIRTLQLSGKMICVWKLLDKR